MLRKRSPLSSSLWKMLLAEDSTLVGSISGAQKITLKDEAKAGAGIPQRATHFVWAYQLDVVTQRLTEAQLAEFAQISSEACFCINGGYVYIRLDEQQEQQVQQPESEYVVHSNNDVQANALTTNVSRRWPMPTSARLTS